VNNMRYWSDEEVVVLRELYPNPNVGKDDLVKVFKRSWKSIRCKANDLGLERKTIYPSDIDYGFLDELRKKLPPRVIE